MLQLPTESLSSPWPQGSFLRAAGSRVPSRIHQKVRSPTTARGHDGHEEDGVHDRTPGAGSGQ